MKLVKMNCPHCGAPLTIDTDDEIIKCEYCESTLKIEDEQKDDISEEAGYQFEMGRLRAKKELEESVGNYEYTPVVHKRLTWLWVVGWVLCFPIPLTVLLARTKKLNKRVKAILITALWVIIALTSIFG